MNLLIGTFAVRAAFWRGTACRRQVSRSHLQYWLPARVLLFWKPAYVAISYRCGGPARALFSCRGGLQAVPRLVYSPPTLTRHFERSGPAFLPHSLLRMRRPAQREISLLL